MLPCLLQGGAEHVWGRGTPTTTKLQQQYYIPRYATDLKKACFEIRAGSVEGQVVSTSSEHTRAQVA